MSVEAPKPVDAAEASPAPVEFTPVAVSEVDGENKVVPAAEEPKIDEPKVEEQPKVEGDAAVAAPVEETEGEKVEEKVVEPIHSGALGYKAPGLKK